MVSICAFVYLYALVFGAVLVLPVLALVPRWRRPSPGLGALWGALTGSIAGGLPLWWQGPLGGRLVFFGFLGAVCGLAYATLVRYARTHQ